MLIRKFLKQKNFYLILVLLLLLVPSFWRMLKPGIYSMHDFHVFRLFEYDKCLADLQFPCRWAPDAAFEYGQPMFNFYGQFPYILGEIYRAIGFSILDSVKALFITSLVISAIGMFILSKKIWQNNFGAIVSALVYVYAPYRAVDVYVRGALPEALAFAFFPFITYFLIDYLEKKKITSLLYFSLLLASLIITHNLSALMYLGVLSPIALYFFIKEKAWKTIPFFILAGLLIFGLTAFYLLPVAFESKLISLQKTTLGYYDFRAHFVVLYQLLISRYWGYGASLWGTDDRLSLSVGHVQWVLPIILAGIIIVQRKIKQYSFFFLLFFLGWGMLFLTHGKSDFLWEKIKPLSFIQFPWRFLGSADFVFAFSSGALGLIIKKIRYSLVATLLIIAALFALNIPNFFEDLWYSYTDHDYFSGPMYQMQIASAVYDYWPLTASKVPNRQTDQEPIFSQGTGGGELLEKRSNQIIYKLRVDSAFAKVQFPTVYFPGWVGEANGQQISLYPSGDFSLITADLNTGTYQINLKFTDTQIRTIGNIISALSLIMIVSIHLTLKLKRK